MQVENHDGSNMMKPSGESHVSLRFEDRGSRWPKTSFLAGLKQNKGSRGALATFVCHVSAKSLVLKLNPKIALASRIAGFYIVS